MKRAIVLLSGGLDSTTALAIAGSEGYEIYALSFDYEQRHKVELESARLVAEWFKVAKHLVINFDLRTIGGSALTSGIEVPKAGSGVQGSGFRDKDQPPIPVTYVPARNTIFLSFALGWAEVVGAEDIFIGANAIDYSGYPDCRPEYIKAFETMANLATKASIEGRSKFKVHAPLIQMSKSEIIRKGLELGVDYSLTWSCYDPQRREEGREAERQESVTSSLSRSITPSLLHSFTGFIPCMRCDSCLIRAKGFRDAGAEDPLVVRPHNV